MCGWVFYSAFNLQLLRTFMKHFCTCFKMVAPSLVIVTLLFASLIILSIPLGPNDVRMASAKALAARMLDLRISVKS